VKVKSCLFMESSLECVLCELLLAFKKEGKTHGLFSSYHYYFLLNICFLACFGHAYTIWTLSLQKSDLGLLMF
jgi:hypothetical protein